MAQNGLKSISDLETYFEGRVLGLAKQAGRNYIVWQVSLLATAKCATSFLILAPILVLAACLLSLDAIILLLHIYRYLLDPHGLTSSPFTVLHAEALKANSDRAPLRAGDPGQWGTDREGYSGARLEVVGSGWAAGGPAGARPSSMRAVKGLRA